MRKILLAATLFVALPATALAMGGSSGGGYGGANAGGGTFTPPSGASSDYSIGLKLLKQEKYSDAIPHLLIALVDKPDDADILNYLGFAKRMVGDYPASLSYYKRALAQKPDHRGAHEYLGELYLDMHDPVSAQKELDTLASLCPSGCVERDTLTKSIAAYVPPAATPAGN